MKAGWQHSPDSWPAAVQITLALVCVVPPVGLVTAGQNAWALCAAAGGIAFWYWLGRNTRGFPFLFDTLGLQVFLYSIVVALLAAVRLARSFLIS